MNPTASKIDATEAEPTPVRTRRGAARSTPRQPKANSAGQPARKRVRVAEGIYKDRHGLAATVKVNGVQREIRFPAGTPLKTIRARRDELRASLRTLPPAERHTLAHDAERYLDQVKNTLLATFDDRRCDLFMWLPRFGHLRTLALPSHIASLNAQMHDWRGTHAASSCNHRRHALIHLVRLLYGRRAAVDLIDLVRFPPAPPQPRWVHRSHLDAVLFHLTPGSKTAARLHLMHWTGMRPSQMGRLTRADFHLDEPIPYVDVPRGKGGAAGRGAAGGRGGVCRAGVYRRRRVRPLVVPERQQGDPRGGPQGGPRSVHGVSDSPLVCDVAPPRGRGSRGHSRSLRAYRYGNDADLRCADAGQAARRDPAAAGRGPTGRVNTARWRPASESRPGLTPSGGIGKHAQIRCLLDHRRHGVWIARQPGHCATGALRDDLAGSVGWQKLDSVRKLLILKDRRVAQLVRAPA